jgi:hypothetical protein
MFNQAIGFAQHRLRHGAILGTISHAVWVARNPLLAAMQSWDGRNYLLNNMSGTTGAITFEASNLVAVFFDAKSPRSPFLSGEPYNIDYCLEGMPTGLLEVAKSEALQYMLQEYEGKPIPIITAAIWSVGETLAAIEPWENVRENGGHIIRIQLEFDDEPALAEWKNDLSLSDSQVELVRAIYRRKLSSGRHRMALSPAEVVTLAPAGGESRCRDILGSIGIDF